MMMMMIMMISSSSLDLSLSSPSSLPQSYPISSLPPSDIFGKNRFFKLQKLILDFFPIINHRFMCLVWFNNLIQDLREREARDYICTSKSMWYTNMCTSTYMQWFNGKRDKREKIVEKYWTLLKCDLEILEKMKMENTGEHTYIYMCTCGGRLMSKLVNMWVSWPFFQSLTNTLFLINRKLCMVSIWVRWFDLSKIQILRHHQIIVLWELCFILIYLVRYVSSFFCHHY